MSKPEQTHGKHFPVPRQMAEILHEAYYIGPLSSDVRNEEPRRFDDVTSQDIYGFGRREPVRQIYMWGELDGQRAYQALSKRPDGGFDLATAMDGQPPRLSGVNPEGRRTSENAAVALATSLFMQKYIAFQQQTH